MPLDETYAETVEYNGRTYQQYALNSGTYFAPIDEVGSGSWARIAGENSPNG